MKTNKLYAFLLLFFIVFPTVGHSVILYKQPRSNLAIVDRTIYINGKITWGITNELYKLKPEEYDRVILYSSGGSIHAAIEIANYIRDNKLKTEIERNGICYSACTVIYQAGISRTAYKTSSFMYHYSTIKKWSKSKQTLINHISVQGTHKYRMAIERFGAKKSLFSLWPKNGDPLYLTAEEASKYGVVQLILY